MKTVISLLILSTAIAASQTVLWQTRMIQMQLGGATGIPELVADEGSRPSLPIGPNGSRFELWGWKLINGVLSSEELLATTEVGTYSPNVDVVITSSDPFAGFHRTRVDQPFSVSFDVSNLLPDGQDIPAASQMVLVEHHADLYPLDSFDGGTVESTNLVRSFIIEQNGLTSYNFPVTNITAPDLARRAGRERLVVYALADGATPQREIASNQITIYPVAEGDLIGLDTTREYKLIPNFSARVWRAYPASSTWLEIYDGEFGAGTRGTKLPSTLETAGHVAPPAFSTIEVGDLPLEFQPTTSGRKTIVLRSSSPFPGESIEEGGRVLAHQTISIGNIITVNAMFSTIE